MRPAWRDERISLLKSALQKHIRRGETDAAMAATARLLELPGGRAAVARRLPVIAAEDVGITYIPAAVVEPGDDNSLLDAVAGLSVLPKDKSAYWLAATVWEGRFPITSASLTRFQDALERADYRTALAQAMKAREERAWRSGDRLIAVVRRQLADAPPLTQKVVQAALQREGKGGSGTGELLAATVIALIDRLDGTTPSLPTTRARSDMPLRLPWYVADGHTAVGARVLRRVAARYGLSAQFLTDLMFCYESVRLGPSEVWSRWQTQAAEMDAAAYGWGDPARGSQAWDALSSEVAGEIQSELERVTL